MYFNQIDEKRRTAIYVRISTAMQKMDRQVEKLVSFAEYLLNKIYCNLAETK